MGLHVPWRLADLRRGSVIQVVIQLHSRVSLASLHTCSFGFGVCAYVCVWITWSRHIFIKRLAMESPGPSDPDQGPTTESKCTDTGPVVWVSDDDPMGTEDRTGSTWDEAVSIMNGELQCEEGDDEEENEECEEYDEDGEYGSTGMSEDTSGSTLSYDMYTDPPVGRDPPPLPLDMLPEPPKNRPPCVVLNASKVKPMVWTTSETTPCSSSQGRDRRQRGPTYRLDQVIPCPVTLVDLPFDHMHPGTIEDLEEDSTGECLLVEGYRASALNSISTQVLDMTLGSISGAAEPVGICGRVELGIFNVFDDEHTDPSLGLRGRPKPTLSGAIGPERSHDRADLTSLRGITVNYAIVTVREARMLTAKAKLLVQSSEARAGNNVMVVRDLLDGQKMLSDETVVPISRPSPTGSTAVDDRLLLLFACKYCGLPCIYGTTIHPIVRYVLQMVLAAVPNRKINKDDLSQKAVHYILKKFTFVFPEVYWPGRADGNGVLTRHLEWIELPNVDADGQRLSSRRRKFNMFPFGRSKDKGVPRMLLGKRRHRTVTVTMNGRPSRHQAPDGVKPLTEFFQKKDAKRGENETLADLQRRRRMRQQQQEQRQQHQQRRPRHCNLPISLPVPIKDEGCRVYNGTDCGGAGTVSTSSTHQNGVYDGVHPGHESRAVLRDGMAIDPFDARSIGVGIGAMDVPPELLGDEYDNFDITQFLPDDLPVGETAVERLVSGGQEHPNGAIPEGILSQATANNNTATTATNNTGRVENLANIMDRLTHTYNSLGCIISELSCHMSRTNS